jgi:hypothetical protein
MGTWTGSRDDMDDHDKSRLAATDHATAAQRAAPIEPLSARGLWQLSRASAVGFVDDYAPSMGAAISYYTVFSMAPLLLIVIAVSGFVFGEDAASGRLFAELSGSLGPDAAAAVQGMVRSASQPGNGLIGTIGGSLMLLVGATTVFAELQSALNRIWRTPASSTGGGIWACCACACFRSASSLRSDSCCSSRSSSAAHSPRSATCGTSCLGAGTSSCRR